MEIQVAIIILLVAVIIAELAIYLIATIVQLFKINAGLSVVLPLVGQIVAKTNPVNPVVDDINAQLVVTRDALENLMLKKAGPDSAGLVESLFPGEGAKFLQRVRRSGKVVNVGTVYTRGVGILASLGRGAPIGAAHAKGAAVRDPQYSTTEVAKLYPAPPDRRDPSRNIPKSPSSVRTRCTARTRPRSRPARVPATHRATGSRPRLRLRLRLLPQPPPARCRLRRRRHRRKASPQLSWVACPARAFGPGSASTHNWKWSPASAGLPFRWPCRESQVAGAGRRGGGLILAAVLALKVGGVVGGTIVPKPAPKPQRPPDTVRFTDTLTDVAIAYPATWVRRAPKDQQVRFVASSPDASAGVSVSVRRSGLEPITSRTLSVVRPLTDDLLRADKRITAIADPVAVAGRRAARLPLPLHVSQLRRRRRRAHPLLPVQGQASRPARPAGRAVVAAGDARADVRSHRRDVPGQPPLGRAAPSVPPRAPSPPASRAVHRPDASLLRAPASVRGGGPFDAERTSAYGDGDP